LSKQNEHNNKKNPGLFSIGDTCIGDTFCDTFFSIGIGIADTFSKKYRKSIADTFLRFFGDTDTFFNFFILMIKKEI
jgi:hypothetical protein